MIRINIYLQIVSDIENGIENGTYIPGKKIPSVRELSSKYNCSKNTVIKAYDTLKSKHIIYSAPKSGYYIVENLFKPAIKKSNIINFYSGNTLIGDMSTPDLKHCLNWAGDLYNTNSFDTVGNGVNSLKEAILQYLTDFQIFTSIKNIYINMGIIDALSLLTHMNFPNNKTNILIEQPSYGFFIESLKINNIPVLGIERSENGIDLIKLEKIFKEEKIKFFYTIPRHHNPLGTTLSKKQRKQIAKLAQKYDVYIVEDDYFSDIDIDEKYDPIFSYSDYQHVIYLKSYSKFMPWMRVGLIVIPDKLLNIFDETIHKRSFNTYFPPSFLSQATLEIYIKSKMLKKHCDAITLQLKEKYCLLEKGLSSLSQHGVKFSKDHSGFYSYIELPNDINENILLAELEKKNVIVCPGNRFFLNNSFYKKGFRISIASVSCDDIINGLKIIKNIIINLKDNKNKS